MNRACFPKKNHQNSQKWAKLMNFSFWPFLWFGLPGRLLIEAFKRSTLAYHVRCVISSSYPQSAHQVTDAGCSPPLTTPIGRKSKPLNSHYVWKKSCSTPLQFVSQYFPLTIWTLKGRPAPTKPPHLYSSAIATEIIAK